MTAPENPWIKWEGGECPVDPDVRVKVRCRDGYVDTDLAGNFAGAKDGLDWWSHTQERRACGGSSAREDDIIAYRVIPS